MSGLLLAVRAANKNKAMSELDKVMIDILGKDAYYSTDFKVTDNVRLLITAVNYLFTQLGQCKKFMSEEDRDYVDGVKKTAIEILKNESR